MSSVSDIRPSKSAALNPAPDGVAVVPELRPDLNGLQLRLREGDPLYLIDCGYKRLIPDEATYKNLFKEGAKSSVDHNLNAIMTGTPIPVGAVLIHETGWMERYTYLVDYAPAPPPAGTKPTLVRRQIGSNDEKPPGVYTLVSTTYQFGKAQDVAPIVAYAIPTGPAVVPPS
jgi:hypothetical protein